MLVLWYVDLDDVKAVILVRSPRNSWLLDLGLFSIIKHHVGIALTIVWVNGLVKLAAHWYLLESLQCGGRLVSTCCHNTLSSVFYLSSVTSMHILRTEYLLVQKWMLSLSFGRTWCPPMLHP
jgi:hypothetical protein